MIHVLVAFGCLTIAVGFIFVTMKLSPAARYWLATAAGLALTVASTVQVVQGIRQHDVWLSLRGLALVVYGAGILILMYRTFQSARRDSTGTRNSEPNIKHDP